jgi:hypothetical protein
VGSPRAIIPKPAIIRPCRTVQLQTIIAFPPPRFQQCATTLCRDLRPTSSAGGRNWVRFARFTPRPSHAPREDCLYPHTPVPPSLALFCTISSGTGPRPVQIGFVSYVSLRGPGHGPHDILYPYTPVHLSLALFCAFTAQPGQIGFVSHILPPALAHTRSPLIRNPQFATCHCEERSDAAISGPPAPLA